MLVFGLLVFIVVFSFYIAVEAMKFGMSERKWFVAAMCFGPIILPMFRAKKRMALRVCKRPTDVSLRA